MGSKSAEKYLDKDSRTGMYYYLRRIPKDFLQFYRSSEKTKNKTSVRTSLKTKDLHEAIGKASAMNRVTEEFWENMFLMDSKTALDRYEAAVIRARTLGVAYISADKVAQRPLRERLDRVAISDALTTADSEAVLGLVDAPELNLSTAFALYCELSKGKLLEKNERQKKQWLNPKSRSIKMFIKEFGDLPINQITPDIALDFRDWLLRRIEDEEIMPNTGNRYLGNVATTIRDVNQHKRLGLYDPFNRVRFTEGMLNTRPPFSREWINEKILARGALDVLNAEAKMILYVTVSTGARLSEICGLAPEDIVLHGDVPHIKIRPNKIRDIKNGHSTRDLPLCGTALEGMLAFPTGFERYAGKGDNASSAINKNLRANGLLETEDHTIYCFRHTAQDAMTRDDVKDRMQCELMGHAFDRPKYGTGPTLQHKHEVMLRICFHAPECDPS